MNAAAPTKSTSDTGAGHAALEVDRLSVDLRTAAGTVRAVDQVSFSVRRGRTLALLGESGCGKSITAQTIAGLLDPIAEVARTGRSAARGVLDAFEAARGDASAFLQAIRY